MGTTLLALQISSSSKNVYIYEAFRGSQQISTVKERSHIANARLKIIR